MLAVVGCLLSLVAVIAVGCWLSLLAGVVGGWLVVGVGCCWGRN